MEGEQADPVLRKTTTKYKVINNLQMTGKIIRVFSDVFFEPISGKEFLLDRPGPSVSHCSEYLEPSSYVGQHASNSYRKVNDFSPDALMYGLFT